jgi:hypothetical protein
MELLGTCVGDDYAIFLPLLPVPFSAKSEAILRLRAYKTT